jgi:hypothetical protein
MPLQANNEKLRLEEKQRQERAAAEAAGKKFGEPIWFYKVRILSSNLLAAGNCCMCCNPKQLQCLCGCLIHHTNAALDCRKIGTLDRSGFHDKLT